MGYKLDSLNIKNSDYIFVSRNGREYELGEVLGISSNLKNNGTYDIITIYDFNAPDPDSPNNTVVELVGWFFGCNFTSVNIRETEQTIREYVDEYETKLKKDMEEKEMKKYKVIEKTYSGDCRGTIFIDLVEDASKTIFCPDVLKDFVNDLWTKLYDELNSNNPIFVGIKSDDYKWDYNGDFKEYQWYRIYDEDGSQYADEIAIEDGEIFVKNACINEAFDAVVKDINENMTDCKFRMEAMNRVYIALEHYKRSDFYIINEEESELVIDIAITKFTKYYLKYEFVTDENGTITITRYDNRKEN